MPLSVAMPCGFEENLMDFECSGGVAGSWGSGGHTVTDFDHPDPLLMVSLNPKDHHSSDGIGAIAGQFDLKTKIPISLFFCCFVTSWPTLREKMALTKKKKKCFK